MTKKAKSDLTADEQQVVADEAAAEVVYQHDLADDELAKLPACTQAVVKAQKENA